MAKKDNVKKPAKTIVIPEHVEYPDVRIQLNDETLEKNDTIIVNIRIVRRNGTEKFNQTEEISLVEFPKSKKLLGRLAFNLVEN